MTALRWLSIPLLALALATGAAWWLQWQAAEQLREEIGLLRGENRDLARLRAENARLKATLPSPSQLEAMRADHAAVLRLRGEIEKLTIESDRQPRTSMHAASPPVPASEWKNAGRSTPAATVETLLWAASHHDIGTFASMLNVDPKLKPAVDQFFAGMSEGLRTKYGTVESLLAAAITYDMPLAAMQIVTEHQPDDTWAAVIVRLQDQTGAEKEQSVPLVQTDNGWGLSVSSNTWPRIANAIRKLASASSGQ